MRSCKYLLIGGGLAAGKAAEMLRQQDAEGSIILVSDERHLPYDHPPLSKEYLRSEKERHEVFLQAGNFYSENRVETLLGNPAQRLDAEKHQVELADGEIIAYEKLLIATGGRPRLLSVPGTDLAGIHYLRTIDDCDAIRAEIEPGRKAVVIGAGFIGMEVAASLAQKGVEVTVIEVAPYIWSRFLDEDLASFFQRYCQDRGIRFFTNEGVASFSGSGKVKQVVTTTGRELPCDFACVGVGIVPNVELAESGGLKIENGIVVDEYLRTSHPDVYAAGDVANYYDPILQKRRRVEHWGHAEYTGLLAAQNMADANAAYNLLSYVWSDIFDLHLEFAGDETEHDQVLLRGRPEDGSFFVLYLKDNALRAYFAINADQRSFPPLQRLIRSATDLSDRLAELQDPTSNLRALLARR